jgi:hypothetical protein
MAATYGEPVPKSVVSVIMRTGSAELRKFAYQ